MEDNTETAYVRLIPDTKEIDEAIVKAKQLCDLMNQAMELADSITNTDLNVRLNAVFNGQATKLANITTE